MPMSFPRFGVTPRHFGRGGLNILSRRKFDFRTVVMPFPEGDIDLSVASCVTRVEAIPIDVYGLYLYHELKEAAFVSLTRKQCDAEELIDRARRNDNLSFVRSMEEFELPAKVRVGSAIEMVSIIFQTEAEEFVSTHKKMMSLIENSTRLEVDGDALVFYDGHTQIQRVEKTANTKLYIDLFTISHPVDDTLDAKISGFTNSNELVQHFERTRTRDFFRNNGARLKAALCGVLRWVDSRSAPSARP